MDARAGAARGGTAACHVSLKRSSKVKAALPSWEAGASWTVAVSGAAATALVATLVSVSSFPLSSVKVTLTLMVLPWSTAARV